VLIGQVVDCGAGAVVLARGLDVECVRRSVDAGARGYLTTSQDVEAFMETIRTVARGGFALAAEVQGALLSQRAPRSAAPALSPRELEILRLMSDGLTGREIASSLYVTEATVKTHVRRLGEKLGERRRAGMILVASRMGLLSFGGPTLALVLLRDTGAAGGSPGFGASSETPACGD
jgi:two-component system nitrate/nitrite response regulator NarL